MQTIILIQQRYIFPATGFDCPIGGSGNPLVFIPVLNVTADATGLISQARVKLFRFDTTANAYAEVTDLTAFQELINNSSISVGFGSGSTTS